MLMYISFSVLSMLEILKYPHILMLLLPYRKQTEVPCYGDIHCWVKSELARSRTQTHVSPYIKYHYQATFIEFTKHVTSTHNGQGENFTLNPTLQVIPNVLTDLI